MLQLVQAGRGQTAGNGFVQRAEAFGQQFSQRLLAAVEDAFLPPFTQPLVPTGSSRISVGEMEAEIGV